MTRILLYNLEPILAEGLGSELRQIDGFELLPRCSTLAGVMNQIGQGAPDLMLLELTGEVTFAVLGEIKRAAANTKIVLWVNSVSAGLAFQAMALGLHGILRRSLPPAVQVQCLKTVQAGGVWFEKAVTEDFLGLRWVALTRRERQLLGLLCQGLRNAEIGNTLMISEGTVKVHLTRLFQKVGVKDRFELALFGLKNLTDGWLPAGATRPEGAGSMPSVILEKQVERARAPRRLRAPLTGVAT